MNQDDDFDAMEARPGGGGAGAFVWVLALLAALVGLIAGMIWGFWW